MHVRTLVYARQWLIAPQVRSWIYLSSLAQKQMSIAALLPWQRPGQQYVKHVGTTGIYCVQTIHMNGSQAVLLRDLIDMSLLMQAPKELVRIHESGDFWTENYMRAWIMVAQGRPQQRFYAYTKSLGMWLTLKDIIPPNFYLTASQGGTLDYLIPKYPEVFQRVAYVVYTEEEAAERGLSVDHDDSHCLGDKPFALLVHGSQRAGSDAMKAITQRKKEGKFVGYSTKNNK
jgi:hypothetical protein